MSPRFVITAVAAALVAAAPAAAQDVVGVPEIDIGEAAAVAGTVIADGETRIGTLDVERIGDKITVTASFNRKPLGKRASLCLTVAGERRCVRRTARRGLKLTLDRTADFTADLRATARSGDALGTVSL